MHIPHKCRSILTIFVALFVLTACNFPLDESVGPYRMVEHRPDRADLLGTWTIDSPTMKFIKSRGGFDVSRPTRLVLRDDDSFVLTRIPAWIASGRSEPDDASMDFEGRWNLDEMDGYWRIILNDSTSNSKPQLSLREPRYRSTPKYMLLIIIGDPDSRESMIFLKDR